MTLGSWLRFTRRICKNVYMVSIHGICCSAVFANHSLRTTVALRCIIKLLKKIERNTTSANIYSTRSWSYLLCRDHNWVYIYVCILVDYRVFFCVERYSIHWSLPLPLTPCFLLPTHFSVIKIANTYSTSMSKRARVYCSQRHIHRAFAHFRLPAITFHLLSAKVQAILIPNLIMHFFCFPTVFAWYRW